MDLLQVELVVVLLTEVLFCCLGSLFREVDPLKINEYLVQRNYPRHVNYRK